MADIRTSLEQKIEALLKAGHKLELSYQKERGYLVLADNDTYVLPHIGKDIKSAINKTYKSEFNNNK